MMALEERLEEVKKEHIWGNIFIKEFSMDAVFELTQAMRCPFYQPNFEATEVQWVSQI
jgi:hypothetical protein